MTTALIQTVVGTTAKPGVGRVSARALHGREQAIMAAALIVLAMFVFASAQPMPILLWDESRNIVNALEMARTGPGVVTTYHFQPDLWNTKPPLLIWLMAGSVWLFGPTEWALRLPSLVATLGLLAMVMSFTRRVTGSLWTAIGAATLLAISPAFFDQHGPRTADYDAPLIFFTTASLMLAFMAVHRRTARAGMVALLAAMMCAAAMTKGVAGIVPLAGAVPYLLLTRRIARASSSIRLWLAGAAVCGTMAIFLVAREAAAPGYLAAMWQNDVSGRFARSLVGDARGPEFYVQQLLMGYFSATIATLTAPFTLPLLRPRDRLLMMFSLCIALVQLGVISAAASKLSHYIMPALPFMAMAAALALRAMVDCLRTKMASTARWDQLVACALLFVMVLPLAIAGQRAIWYRPPFILLIGDQDPEQRYGTLLPVLARQGNTAITLVEPGFTLENRPHYAPVARSYQLMWEMRRLKVDVEPELALLDPSSRGVVASCAPQIVSRLRETGADLSMVVGCAVRQP